MPSFSSVFSLILVLALGACATVATHETSQAVHVASATPEGVGVSGVNCQLKNDRGAWSVVAPGTVNVLPSDSPLLITCNKSGFQLGSLAVDKLTEGVVMGHLGNLGKLVIGSAHTAKPAYMTQGMHSTHPAYPSSVTVLMNLTTSERTQSKTLVSPHSHNGPNATFDLEGAQKQCAEIGLIKGTENFGLCVLKLMK